VRLPFDRRNDDPKKNYGLHGLDIWFILQGPKGAVQYAVTVQINLPHVAEERGKWTYEYGLGSIFSGFDVGYHSPVAQYEGQTQMDCQTLEGGKCYYDGSSLRADDWTKEIFAARGDQIPEDIIGAKLEAYYNDRFRG
jgi:hypothetical protein